MPNAAELVSEPFAYVFPSGAGRDASGHVRMTWAADAKPFSSVVPLRVNTRQSAVLVLPNAFTAEECARIVEIGEAAPRIAGEVDNAYSAMRSSELSWIEPAPETHWLYHRIGLMFLEVNRTYGFDLKGLQEPLQFSRYAEAGRFDWHIDMGTSTSGRKLSLSVQLTDPDAYEGGDLEFISQSGSRGRERGTAIFFPSYLAHRVTPVARGLRRTLIAWAYGPSFV
jgi:PKHD-type hydroxylase